MRIKSILSVIIASAFVVSAQAAPKKPVPAKPVPVKREEPKNDNYPLYGEVVKVTATALIIKGAEGKEDRKFAFTETSKIVAGEKDAKLSDIKVGRRVGGLVRKAGKGDDLLLKVNVDVNQDGDEEKPVEKPKATAKKPATTTTPKKKAS